jgi:DsbC/DsbD-like thiol-disulfide interchange protein
MLKPLAIVILTFAASPALAGATPWQEIAPDARARLISSDTLSNGALLAGLEIDMPSTSKTYWRVPGESGIPTTFDFSASTNVGTPAIDWPFPSVDRTGGLTDYVYRGPVVIPIELKPGQGAAGLEVSIVLGICSDICVPAQAKFNLPIDPAHPDSAQSIRLSQAEAQVPIAWDKADPPFGAVTATPDGIAITDPSPNIDPTGLIADVGDPAILFSTPQKSPDGTLWTLKLLGGAAGKGLEGRPVQLTFMTASGPYAVSRQIAAPAR